MPVEKTVARKLQKQFGLKYMVCLGIAKKCRDEAEAERVKILGKERPTPEQLLAKKEKEIDDRILRGITRSQLVKESGVEPFSETWFKVACKYVRPVEAT